MNGEERFERLPAVYARALSLRDEGVSPVEIAAELGIDPDAIETFFALAEAKLASARDHDE